MDSYLHLSSKIRGVWLTTSQLDRPSVKRPLQFCTSYKNEDSRKRGGHFANWPSKGQLILFSKWIGIQVQHIILVATNVTPSPQNLKLAPFWFKQPILHMILSIFYFVPLLCEQYMHIYSDFFPMMLCRLCQV